MDKLPSAISEKDSKGRTNSTFTIDWKDLKEIATAFVNGKTHSLIKLGRNSDGIRSNTFGVSRWNGYSADELRSWLDKGFRTDGIGIEIQPPVREKRRYIYSEDAEELHIDRALSGEDNYAGEFTKRKIIPGVAILVNIDFAAMVNASVVNAYNVFVCQCIQSLEASGVDCEITIQHSATGLIDGVYMANTIVRVKKENEASDFGSFSPMISPAAFRSLMFAAMYAHAESLGKGASHGLGYGRYHDNPNHKWDVFRDEKTQTIVFDCPRSASDFPKSTMQAKFQQVLGISD